MASPNGAVRRAAAPAAVTRQLLRIATAGSVDDGKSTLIGRLLHDTDSLPVDHLESVTDQHGVADLAALSDGLRAEREQGITIDVAYRFFSTATRSYILADTPGHERYTRNMFTGASNAHVAIMLVDSRAGVLRQTRRHARIAKLLGIKHFVATVNKIDLVDFDQVRFTAVEDQLRQMAERLGGVADLTVIPIAAVHGDNVVHRSERTPWYGGPTLLEYLEGVELAAPNAEASWLRLPIQWVSRPTDNERRRYTGRLSAGTLSVGDPVVSLPAGTRSTVTAVDTLDDERAVGVAPLSVSIELADDIDVGRGDVLVSGADDAVLPVLARELDATVCWFADRAVRAGDRLTLKQATRTVRATVQQLHTRLDPETLDELDGPAELALNDIGMVTLRTNSLLVTDAYVDNRDSGAFILIDEATNDTVGAGTILEPREVQPGSRTRTDIRWHPSSLDRAYRWRATGQPGATIWFTGLATSGKSTIALAVERALVESGRVAYLLDGDNLRHGLSDDLGLSPADRAENIRRVGHLTRLLADAGVVALASPASPLQSDREIARALNEAAKVPFIEVYVATSRNGQNGADAPYEPPENPDLVLDTTEADVDGLVAKVVDVLTKLSPRR
jgi:bifunctional enzyme CysN/CysC